MGNRDEVAVPAEDQLCPMCLGQIYGSECVIDRAGVRPPKQAPEVASEIVGGRHQAPRPREFPEYSPSKIVHASTVASAASDAASSKCARSSSRPRPSSFVT